MCVCIMGGQGSRFITSQTLAHLYSSSSGRVLLKAHVTAQARGKNTSLLFMLVRQEAPVTQPIRLQHLGVICPEFG